MGLEVSLPNRFDSPGAALLDIGCAAIGYKRDACICIFGRMASAAQKGPLLKSKNALTMHQTLGENAKHPAMLEVKIHMMYLSIYYMESTSRQQAALDSNTYTM